MQFCIHCYDYYNNVQCGNNKKSLLISCLQVRKWLQPEPPAVTDFIEIMKDIYVMKRRK